MPQEIRAPQLTLEQRPWQALAGQDYALARRQAMNFGRPVAIEIVEEIVTVRRRIRVVAAQNQGAR